MFRVDLNGSIFQLTLWGWNIKVIGTRIVRRHQARCLSGISLIWLFKDCFHTFLRIFYRPLWIIPRRVKWFEFSVGTKGGETSNSLALWRSIGIRPHVYQGFPHICLFNDCLHTYLCKFYIPLWIIPRWVKWFDFSVGPLEVKHQTHRYFSGRSASGPMFIRGFPLYGYFMALYTPCFAYFIARCEMLRVK